MTKNRGGNDGSEKLIEKNTAEATSVPVHTMKVYDNGDVLALILTSSAKDNVAFKIYLLLPWKKSPIIP